jgi:hypothetical protein
MCEGSSQEEVLAEDAAIIAEHGHLVTGVGDGDPPHWTYTVGLLDRFGHPELIVAGPHFRIAASIINHVGRQIRDGARFGAGDTIRVAEGEIFECEATLRVGALDPIQYRLDTFNMWFALAAHGVVRVEELRAVQLVAPSDVLCPCGLCDQADLAWDGCAPTSSSRTRTCGRSWIASACTRRPRPWISPCAISRASR